MRTFKFTVQVIFLGLVLLSASLPVSAQIQHNHGYVRFCNEGDTNLVFTLVTREGVGIMRDNWTAQGLYRVDRHSCNYLAEDVSVAIQMYVGIRRDEGTGNDPDVFIDVSGAGGKVRQVNESFCTQRTKFSRSASFQSSKKCSSGYSLQPFRILIILPPLIEYTLAVTDPGANRSASSPAANTRTTQGQQAGQPAEKKNWYLADDEDPERAEALRIKEQKEEEARQRARDAETAHYQAVQAWVEESYSRANVCQEIEDLDTRYQCMSAYLEPVKRVTLECSGRMELQAKKDCFAKIKRALNDSVEKWLAENNATTTKPAPSARPSGRRSARQTPTEAPPP